MFICKQLGKFKTLLNNEKLIIFLILFLAVIIRFDYINSILYFENSHDVAPYVEIHGHAGYIYHLLQNNFNIFDFDPLSYSQYYHPPLHHLISAVFIKICLKFVHNIDKAFEILQYLTLFYTVVITYIGYLILKELNLKNIALYTGVALIAFHPTMTFFAASLNNDCLLMTFEFAIILFSIKWYKTCNLKTMITCALLIGFATFTKLSGIIMCVPLLTLIAIKFVQEKELRLKILKDCIISFIVSIPLVCFWNLWGYFKYNIPLGHVQNSGGNEIIVKNFIIGRFLSLPQMNLEQILYIINPSIDYNIPIYLLKTSMFGEWGVPNGSFFLANTLYWSNFCLIILSLIAALKLFIDKTSITLGIKIYLFCLYLTFLFCYSNFNKLYPYFYTQDYRYFATTLILTSICIAFLFKQTKNIILKIFICLLVFTFCISSFLINMHT